MDKAAEGLQRDDAGSVDKEVAELVEQLENELELESDTCDQNSGVKGNNQEVVEKNLELSLDAKERGNALYKSLDFLLAIEEYKQAIDYAPEEEKEHISKCFANCSACYLLLNEYENVVEFSSKAIELDETYVKAYLRRANASEKLEKFGDAIDDLKKVLEIQPGNRNVMKELNALERRAKEHQEKQKEEVMGMFQ